MEHHSIRSFRPIETREENTDQDRTVLRLCDGLLAVPVGSLSSGPELKPLWGITNLPTRIATALSGANSAKAHFVTITRGSHVFVVVWSLQTSAALGMFYVTAGTPADFNFDSTDAVTVASAVNAVYRDKSPTLPWFASRIGERWYFGNGTDDNVKWSSGALSAMGPASAPADADLYNPSRVKIPPCKSFVVGTNRSVFAAGNVTTPKRVWITNAPVKDFPYVEGIYSLSTSFVDLDYTDASKVTALSAFQNYITAHTDAKPVNLYNVDGSDDGWKCVQAPGAANASAPSPAAVRDTNGIASFYLGADGEVYQDQAIRVGPNDKRPARDQDIATGRAAGDWNRDMKKPVLSGKAHTFYDRTQELFWIFAEIEGFAGRFGLWAYNERTRSVSGPFDHFNAPTSCAISGNIEGSSALIAVLTATGEMLYSDFGNVGEVDEFMNEGKGVPLGPEFEAVNVTPTPTPGLSFVSMTENNKVFRETIADGSSALMVDPWSYFETEGTYEFAKHFNDAYVARFETAFEDLGNSQARKNYLELRMTWQRHSRAYVGLYAETEDGRRHGKWRGLVFDKEEHVVPINLHGRRIRVRGVIVLFNGAPALLRDISIGYNLAGTT